MRNKHFIWLVATVPSYSDDLDFTMAFADKNEAERFSCECNQYNDNLPERPAQSEYKTVGAFDRACERHERALLRWRAKHPAGKDFCHWQTEFQVLKLAFVPAQQQEG